jgi:integrase
MIAWATSAAVAWATSTGRPRSSRSRSRPTQDKAASSQKRPRDAKRGRPDPQGSRACSQAPHRGPLTGGAPAARPKGGVLTTASIRRATHWDSLVVKLGLPNLKRHGLRHTGATWLADSGVPLHVLQQMLGPRSIETTRLYLHPDTRHLLDAARQANAFLSKPARRETKPTRAPGV